MVQNSVTYFMDGPIKVSIVSKTHKGPRLLEEAETPFYTACVYELKLLYRHKENANT